MSGAARIGQLTGEAARYLATQNRTPLHPDHTPTPTPASAIVLAGILHRTRTHPHTPIPALHDLPTGWTGYPPEDISALLRLHTARVLTVADTTPPHAFHYVDGTLTLRIAHAHLEPTGGHDHAQVLLDRTTAMLAAPGRRAARQREELTRLVHDMEVRAVLRYTDALLTTRHGLTPVPDEHRPALAEHITRGLTEHTYTCGQLATLAHRAVCSADDWAPAADAPTATVDFFDEHLARAHARRAPIPEQDIPTWAGPPAALVAGRVLLHHVTARQ
ncbi:hypothetical protein ACFU0X_10330 [Streptomyces cellulosae]|uniref:Hemerythrin-like domain-containing protein n=1 Tax=Streptomyces cellulosae TaxID=1968 RepID=A0ABW6JGZ5_STRCE